MIRFLVNLLVYGLVFFLIYKFLPETFQTLVTWISFIYDFLSSVLIWAYEKIQTIIGAVTTSSK